MEKQENEKSQMVAKNNKKLRKKISKFPKLSKSSRYFDFYDDIKSGCQKRVDW